MASSEGGVLQTVPFNIDQRYDSKCKRAVLAASQAEWMDKPYWQDFVPTKAWGTISNEVADADGDTLLAFSCNDHRLRAEFLFSPDETCADDVKISALRHTLENGCLLALQALMKREVDVNNIFHEKENYDGQLTFSVPLRVDLEQEWNIGLSLTKIKQDYILYLKEGTSLTWSCLYGHRRATNLLIGAGADVNRSGWRGWAPIHVACLHGSLSVVQLLIENGADFDKAADCGWTPLYLAYRNILIVQVLINHGADINHTSNTGDTAFHFACSKPQDQWYAGMLMSTTDCLFEAYKSQEGTWTYN